MTQIWVGKFVTLALAGFTAAWAVAWASAHIATADDQKTVWIGSDPPPDLIVAECRCFGALGYHLVIYPVSMLRVAMGAVTRALETLKRDGTVEPFLGDMQTREQLYELVGYTPGTPWEFPAEVSDGSGTVPRREG